MELGLGPRLGIGWGGGPKSFYGLDTVSEANLVLVVGCLDATSYLVLECFASSLNPRARS